MARRRYYYRRVVRPKQKWAINNVDVRILNSTQVTIPGGANALYFQTGVLNGTRIQSGSTDVAYAAASTAQILKCGRFKLRGCIPSTSNLSYTVFISYVPEGYTITQGAVSDQNIFYQHPEWIIGWTRKDYIVSNQSNEISITSRLKRNLNTGDGIIIGVMINNTSNGEATFPATFVLQGVLSYCCRAN